MWWSKTNKKVLGLEIYKKQVRGVFLLLTNKTFVVEDYFTLTEGELEPKLKQLKPDQVFVVTPDGLDLSKIKDIWPKSILKTASQCLGNLVVNSKSFSILFDLNNSSLVVALEEGVIKSESRLDFSLAGLIENIALASGLSPSQVKEIIASESLSGQNKVVEAMLLSWLMYINQITEPLLNIPSRFPKQIILLEDLPGLQNLLRTKNGVEVIKSDIFSSLPHQSGVVPKIPQSLIGEYKLALGASLSALN